MAIVVPRPRSFSLNAAQIALPYSDGVADCALKDSPGALRPEATGVDSAGAHPAASRAAGHKPLVLRGLSRWPKTARAQAESRRRATFRRPSLVRAVLKSGLKLEAELLIDCATISSAPEGGLLPLNDKLDFEVRRLYDNQKGPASIASCPNLAYSIVWHLGSKNIAWMKKPGHFWRQLGRRNDIVPLDDLILRTHFNLQNVYAYSHTRNGARLTTYLYATTNEMTNLLRTTALLNEREGTIVIVQYGVAQGDSRQE